jgi:ribosomal protein S18 acetylase RimI-like enzyme
MEELSARLQTITGDSGKNSFDPQDVCSEWAVFVIARNEEGKAIGCGAFRPANQTTVEVKRMYAKEQGRGVGRQILTYLEHKAYEMGYETLCLETRLVNTSAVSFYERNGYKRIPI